MIIINRQMTVQVDSIKKVTTAGLNRLMPHVPQKFLRVLPSRKPGLLRKLHSYMKRPSTGF